MNSTDSRPPITAIVLAGGRSSRFGRDKLTERIGDETLLDRAIGAVVGIASEVVVVRAASTGVLRSGAGPDWPSPSSDSLPIRVVHDAQPFPGPLAAVAIGLSVTRQSRAIVVGGDMPYLDPAVLRLLAAEVRGSTAAAVLALGTDLVPLPCALRVDAARAGAEALLAVGQRSLRALLARLEARAIAELRWRSLDPAGATLRDIDVPGDLDAATAEIEPQGLPD